jgi:hypothetical protein
MSKEAQTPAWLIERLAQGELPAAAAEEVRARLRAEGRDPDEVLASLAASNRAVLEEMPKRVAAASIRARLEASKAARRPRGWLLALPGLAVAAGVALLVVRLPDGNGGGRIPPPGASDQPTERGKGSPRPPMRLFVYRYGQSDSLAHGARAARGDLLQLAYVARDPGYGVIVSLDGAGRVTLHLPTSDGERSAPLTTAREVRLPSSYELDDAPRFEQFFLVTAAEPFAVAPIVDAARTLAGKSLAPDARLPLPAQFNQASFRIEKAPKEQP